MGESWAHSHARDGGSSKLEENRVAFSTRKVAGTVLACIQLVPNYRVASLLTLLPVSFRTEVSRH